MFSAKPSAPAAGGLSINTSSANSLFSNTSTPSTTQPAIAGLFENQQKPAGSLFGNPSSGTTQTSGGGLFGGQGTNTTSTTQQSGMASGGLFGSSTATSQPASGGLFGNTAKPATPSGGLFGNTNTQQTGTAGGGLFGATNTQQQNTIGGSSLFGGNQGATAQTQTKSLFGTAPTTTGMSLFGNTQNAAQQQQQQQQQKPTLSIFGSQNTTTQPPQAAAAAAQGAVVQGVRVDASNLLPTTKFESCADEIKRTIEQIDTYILNQISMCNDVAGILPTIASQGSTIPNDVEFVEGKLETIQLALENDAREIDAVRNMVARNAAEAQVGFRAIDNLKLPLQYQSTGGGWWSVSEQQLSERQTLRSSIKNRKSTLALPDGVEGDPSTSDSINGIPTNLVEYFSHRSDEMSTVLEGYKKNLKEIEDHLHGVEGSLNRQINEFLSSRNRDDGIPGGAGARNQLADLAAALGDVEAGILGVASRLGGVKEEVQELILGPPTLGMGRLG
ncbi:Nucleoporin nup49/NSP49 (Nuclear pore protein nup49/NSP49) [Talaromyces marneffei ATCC 18224]|uniref:Nucleoporin NUP49/NSP49, putative n=3 Tax=Talaromyces marneffei TaxID=37727 RepID=B6Q7M4_TALMQ|nr:nucleoporin NUP49/NSP49, putative [Talaromyces marneffei ATCC 18224]KAE8555627.1 hypothetical protein EYB25_000325 [Talaromyces marneffei]